MITGTLIYQYKYILVYTIYILVHTSTYWYEPVHTIYTILIPLGTIMYCYVSAHTPLGTRLLNIALSLYKAVQGGTLVSCIPEQGRARPSNYPVLSCSGIQDTRYRSRHAEGISAPVDGMDVNACTGGRLDCYHRGYTSIDAFQHLGLHSRDLIEWSPEQNRADKATRRPKGAAPR